MFVYGQNVSKRGKNLEKFEKKLIKWLTVVKSGDIINLT